MILFEKKVKKINGGTTKDIPSTGIAYPARRPAMDTQQPTTGCSAFMISHLPEFFDHFGINYTIDGPQFEYFIYDIKNSQDISCSITLNYDEAALQINFMSFYPGIFQQKGCRYLSAVCFFLIIHHFANFHHIGPGCRILFNTRQGVFDNFYALLKDFDFHVLVCGEEDRVDVESLFIPMAIDTSMIRERALKV